MTMDPTDITNHSQIPGNYSISNGTVLGNSSNFSSISITPLDVTTVTVTIVSSSLSILGAAAIIYTFLALVDTRTTSRKLLVYLSISNIVLSVGNILGAADYLKSVTGPLCRLSAVVSAYGIISCSLWTAALTLYIYTSLVWSRITTANKFLWPFHFICWGIPASITIVGLAFHVLGYSVYNMADPDHRPVWCWINSKMAHSTSWGYLTGVGWEMVAIFMCILLFTLLVQNLNKQAARLQTNDDTFSYDSIADIQTANRQLTFIPLVFVVLRIWGVFRFLVITYNPGVKLSGGSDTLLLFQAFTDNSQGFVNCILYFYYTKKIKKRIRLKRLFGTTRKLPFAQKLSSSTAFRARFHVNPLAEDDVIYSITDHNETEERRLIH